MKLVQQRQGWRDEGIAAKTAALEDVHRALERGDASAIPSLRRLLRSIRVSLGSQAGDPELGPCLDEGARAGGAAQLGALDRLLSILRRRSADSPLGGIGILIVEDEADVAEILRMRLASPSRSIHCASTVGQAEKILYEEDISLILLDILLPGTDGRDLLLRLREHPRSAAVQIIVLSAQVAPHVKTECFALGADEYFEKPFHLREVSTAVAAALQRSAEIASESRRDPLTQLSNRADFEEAFVRERHLALRLGSPLSIASLDRDRFKAVNDLHGHAAGDEVLRRAAAILRSALRSSDLLARWGGEEFVVLLPNTLPHQGAQALEKALEALRAESFDGQHDVAFHVSFSAGVGRVRFDQTIEQAVANADLLLYRAKAEGRNRIVREAALEA